MIKKIYNTTIWTMFFSIFCLSIYKLNKDDTTTQTIVFKDYLIEPNIQTIVFEEDFVISPENFILTTHNN